MVINNMYRYLGVNGVITTPIKIEGAYSVELVQLTADDKCILHNTLTGENRFSVIIPKDEIENWMEQGWSNTTK